MLVKKGNFVTDMIFQNYSWFHEIKENDDSYNENIPRIITIFPWLPSIVRIIVSTFTPMTYSLVLLLPHHLYIWLELRGLPYQIYPTPGFCGKK